MSHHHPTGVQVWGGGRVPRLSIGTLQLSIRCSPVHLPRSRSFPVSAAGLFEGWIAACGVGRSAGLSWADAATVRQIANDETSNRLYRGLMDGPRRALALGAVRKRWRQ